MKIRGAIVVVGVVLLSAVGAFAQDYAKIEIPIGYSYVRFNPENSNIVSAFSLNGGGGGVAFYFNHVIGVQMDLKGYASTVQSYTFPVGTPACPSGCNITADGNLFTYSFGPIIKPYRTSHFEPFIEAMGGGAHSNTYGNILRACQAACTTSAAPSNNAWEFVIGGGLDIPLTRSIAFRPVEVNYVLTRFNNILVSNHMNQSNFRYGAGLVFMFGR
jgi:hypothetical protein